MCVRRYEMVGVDAPGCPYVLNTHLINHSFLPQKRGSDTEIKKKVLSDAFKNLTPPLLQKLTPTGLRHLPETDLDYSAGLVIPHPHTIHAHMQGHCRNGANDTLQNFI